MRNWVHSTCVFSPLLAPLLCCFPYITVLVKRTLLTWENLSQPHNFLLNTWWSSTGLKVVKSGHSTFNSESLHCMSRRDNCWQTLERLFLYQVLTDRDPSSSVSLGTCPLPTISSSTEDVVFSEICFQECGPRELHSCRKKLSCEGSWADLLHGVFHFPSSSPS